VEITNTRGMSQHADGGIVGTKPYISSANYINKMSDYCVNCHYAHKNRTGNKACPFNSLYWNFLDRNREKLKDNPRMNIPYSLLKRMNDYTLKEINSQAEKYLKEIEKL
jgi:deoxyribodipyrimidine photolyase-related protein